MLRDKSCNSECTRAHQGTHFLGKQPEVECPIRASESQSRATHSWAMAALGQRSRESRVVPKRTTWGAKPTGPSNTRAKCEKVPCGEPPHFVGASRAGGVHFVADQVQYSARASHDRRRADIVVTLTTLPMGRPLDSKASPSRV